MKTSYLNLSRSEMQQELSKLMERYEEEKKKDYRLDMSRGKPDPMQLNLSMHMFEENPYDLIYSRKGTDVRNYGELAGVDEAKEFFAELLGVGVENVIVGGQSSLCMMYDAMIKAVCLGVYKGSKPWGQQGPIKFLCPSPGYDRHFRISQEFGMDLVTIPMLSTGPDMDMVRQYVENDPSVKGIWCVPKYSNPTGITYSPETVEAFAALKPAADDFRIFWDNAYFVHGFNKVDDHLVNIFDACKKYGSEDMVYEFFSTSKVTFSGAGIAVFISSEGNTKFMLRQMGVQTIGYNKINQLRHIRFFKDLDGLHRHMHKHAALMRPKFYCTLATLERQLSGLHIGTWTHPNGGYFISYNGLPGTAERCVQLCKDCGVILTNAGAAFPYGVDPEDRHIRIAPSYPTTEQLYLSMNVFCLCQRIAALEVLLKAKEKEHAAKKAKKAHAQAESKPETQPAT